MTFEQLPAGDQVVLLFAVFCMVWVIFIMLDARWKND